MEFGKMFVYGNLKVVNTNEQVRYCNRLLFKLGEEMTLNKNTFYEFRFVGDKVQLLTKWRGIETYYETEYGENKKVSDYIEYFKKELIK